MNIYYFLRSLFKRGRLENISDGYIGEKEKESDHVFGFSQKDRKVLSPEGDWTDSLPEDERQNR